MLFCFCLRVRTDGLRHQHTGNFQDANVGEREFVIRKAFVSVEGATEKHKPAPVVLARVKTLELACAVGVGKEGESGW